MRLSDNDNDYDCTTCGTTGGVCMEAVWLGRRLAQGLARRAGDLPEEFEVVSDSRFQGCGRSCAVRLRITAAAVEIDAGVGGARVEARPLAPCLPAAARS